MRAPDAPWLTTTPELWRRMAEGRTGQGKSDYLLTADFVEAHQGREWHPGSFYREWARRFKARGFAGSVERLLKTADAFDAFYDEWAQEVAALPPFWHRGQLYTPDPVLGW